MNHCLYTRWLAGLSLTAVFFLSACSGEESGTSPVEDKDIAIQVDSEDDLPACTSKRDGESAQVGQDIYTCENREWVKEDESSLSQVETVDDLPNCTSKREGERAYVEEEEARFVCEDGEWVEAKKPVEVDEYESIDDLPNCTSKREGVEVYVEEEDVDYVCEDGEWVEIESDSDGKSSESKDDKTSSNSVKSSSSDGGSAVSGDVAKKRIGPVSQYGQLQAGAPSGTGRIYGSCKGVKSGNESWYRV